MEYKILYNSEENLLRQIANIHYESLTHFSFLIFFGPEFLFQLYKRILKHQLGFFAIALNGNEVLGFALLCFDTSKLMPAVLKNPWHFIFLSISTVLKRPLIIIKMLKTIFYFKNTGSDINKIKPEFLAMAIKKGTRSKGIGTTLIEKFENEYKKQGIIKYKFAITQENKKSVDFFRRRGFNVVQTFNFANSIWNIYVKKLLI